MRSVIKAKGSPTKHLLGWAKDKSGWAQAPWAQSGSVSFKCCLAYSKQAYDMLYTQEWLSSCYSHTKGRLTECCWSSFWQVLPSLHRTSEAVSDRWVLGHLSDQGPSCSVWPDDQLWEEPGSKRPFHNY